MGSPSHPFTFDDLYKTIIIMISFWSLGKLTSKCGLPALCGEIISGIIVGPHLLDWAPKPDSLMMFGELGLMLLFLEAGLDIDMEMIRLVGKRGVLLSVLASTISLTVGTFFSYFLLDLPRIESLSVGIALAPTSMGIGLNVLRSCKGECEATSPLYLYKTIIIMISFWSLGKLTSKCGLPALCGEIISGIIVGPHLLDWAPKPDSLMMFGELGLMLLFLEAGLDIDMEMIRLVGKRGVLLSVLASTISLTVGTFFSYFLLDLPRIESLSVGIALAPTSMGIGLNVLRSCKGECEATSPLLLSS